MPKEKSKLKALISFVILEIMIYATAWIVSQLAGKIPLIPFPKAAIFLGIFIFYNLAVAGIGLRDWKRGIQQPISKGEL